MSFENTGLSAELLRAVKEQGYTQPTPVQEQAIPAILQGHDILAGAQTGTGKTAGFTLPLLQRLAEKRPQGGNNRDARALILAPTRELAGQVLESVRVYGKYTALRSLAVYGGVKIGPQIKALRRGIDILVATPGRLLDLVDQRELNLSRVEILVLDEADRMLDMGFIPAIRRIVGMLPTPRQTLFFSATYSSEIRKLTEGMLANPVRIEVAPRNATVQSVRQRVHPVPRQRKRELLSELIGAGNWRQVLVFTRTKRGADKLARQLNSDGLGSTAIHGNKTQGARTKALSDFKGGKTRVLVATDIAARGLDIDQLPYVVNFDLPMVAEDYVHRIGRTGRAGNSGEAVSLVCADERPLLQSIEKLLKRPVKLEPVAGYEPDFDISKPVKARPSSGAKRGGRNSNSGNGRSRPAGGNGKARPGGGRNARSRRGGGQSRAYGT